MNTTDIFSFSEWYHYVILLLWLIILFFGVKNFQLIESLFKPKETYLKGHVIGKKFLTISFLLGVMMVLIWMFKPAELTEQSQTIWQYLKYSLYFIFILILVVNLYISYTNYQIMSNFIRMLLMSLLMIVYFYSGMFGGLFIVALTALVILVYALVKFKNILKIG